MKPKSNPPKKTEPGILLLILAAILLTAIGMWLEDAPGFSYDSFGGIIWFGVLIVSFMFGLLFFAQYVLPLPGNEGWSEGLRLLWRHYTAQGQSYLNNFGQRSPNQPKSRKSKKLAAKPSQPKLPASFTALKAGILKSHQVLALGKGNEFIRPTGPGFVMLFKKESPTLLVDLRKQLRRQPVKATTRDGIPVETNVTVIFRVRQEREDNPGAEPYPYDKDAIFHLCYTHSIDARDKVRGWTEQISPRAAALLIAELHRFTMDELYGAANGGIGPLDQIKANIKRQLERQMDPDVIEIIVVGVDKLTLPKIVVDQRIKTWQADWERRITLQQAARDAEEVRRIKRARARAQIEIIENITQNITNVRRTDGADLSHIITLRMIEALEEAKSSAALQALLPQQVMTSLVMNTSEQMQAWLNQPKEVRP